ncbi:MAG: hypothetical protein CMM52_11915 [Rhodospirillaceae bacterium]|nr:hypothetical protein [Rhodospirillaceae bacterium]
MFTSPNVEKLQLNLAPLLYRDFSEILHRSNALVDSTVQSALPVLNQNQSISSFQFKIHE